MKTLALGLVAGAVVVLLLGAAAHGFQPTRERAGDVAAEGARLARAEEFELRGEELTAEVVALLVDRAAGTTAVVVEIANPRARSLGDVSVAVDVLDRAGEEIGTNAAPGTDPSLNHLPSVLAGESALYVVDSIVPEGEPVSARVEAGGDVSGGALRPVRVRNARIESSIYGTSVVGRAVNPGDEPLANVLVQAVVRKRGEIVAAGTARVPRLAPGAAVEFQIFLVGKPKGGKLTAWAPSL